MGVLFTAGNQSDLTCWVAKASTQTQTQLLCSRKMWVLQMATMTASKLHTDCREGVVGVYYLCSPSKTNSTEEQTSLLWATLAAPTLCSWISLLRLVGAACSQSLTPS